MSPLWVTRFEKLKGVKNGVKMPEALPTRSWNPWGSWTYNSIYLYILVYLDLFTSSFIMDSAVMHLYM